MASDPERHKRTVAALAASLHDALICSSPTEVLLLTGYWPVMGSSLAILTSSGDATVIVPEDEVELAEKTSSAEIVPYKPAGLRTLESPLQLLKEPLRSVVMGLSLSKARIGIQLAQGIQPSSYAVCAEFRASLLELLVEIQPRATYEGCDELLELMKATKTAKELELMQTAARVAATGFAEAAEHLQPGLRETDVAAAAHGAFETTREAESLERSYGYFFCMSGPNSAKASAAYARTRQRVIQEGDLVMIHANTCADGYWTDLTRTYIAGQPSERQRDMRTAICEARAGRAARHSARSRGPAGGSRRAISYGSPWSGQSIQACGWPRGGFCGCKPEWQAENPPPFAGCARGGHDLQS